MSNNTDWQQIARAFGLLTLIGITILANIAVGFWLGKFIDSFFHFELFFKIIGIILGVISGFYSVYRLINNILGDNNEHK
ncbi:MAG: AtpZ/AtpI family protein [Halanaerobiales bacterium]